MTVIAWDGKTLAADKRNTSYGYASTVTKIRRLPDGRLAGASGDCTLCMALLEWAATGMPKDSFPKGGAPDETATLVVIERDGRAVSYAKTPLPLLCEDAYYAMGAGRDYALAALYLGHDARKAVEVACALDVHCGNGIDTLTLETDHATV